MDRLLQAISKQDDSDLKHIACGSMLFPVMITTIERLASSNRNAFCTMIHRSFACGLSRSAVPFSCCIHFPEVQCIHVRMPHIPSNPDATMASAGRAPQALTKNLSSAARPHYVCRACRIVQREAQQLRHRSGLSSGHRSRSATSTSIEQRRPISIPSLFRRTQKPQEPQEDALQEAEEDPNAVPMEPYVEATTWDGLEHMGHQRHWKDLPPDAKDDYEP